MKDLEQLKKDLQGFHEQLGKTIAELEKPKELYWTDLPIGDTFCFLPPLSLASVVYMVVGNPESKQKYHIALRRMDGVIFVPSGSLYENDRDTPIVVCDINGNPLEGKK